MVEMLGVIVSVGLTPQEWTKNASNVLIGAENVKKFDTHVQSVKFIGVVRITQHVGSCVDYTQNIFVRSWGVNPTDTIPPNDSTITRQAYDHIYTFHGFVLRFNHERLRLNQVELKHIRSEELIDRIRDNVRDDILNNACSPANHALGDASSNDSESNDGWLDTYNYEW